MKQKYSVKGMTCSACENHVHNSVCKLPGVNNVEVNLLTNSMNVEFDENQVNDAMIIKAVSDGGYQANVFSDSLVDDDDLSKLKKKLGDKIDFYGSTYIEIPSGKYLSLYRINNHENMYYGKCLPFYFKFSKFEIKLRCICEPDHCFNSGPMVRCK